MAAQKLIRGLLNSRWADTQLIFLYCTNTWHHTTIHLQATGQHKNKAGLTHSPVYYPAICINTHGQYTTPTCPKCACKISQIFLRVFEITLAEFCAKFDKINVPRIFPPLQYLVFISCMYHTCGMYAHFYVAINSNMHVCSTHYRHSLDLEHINKHIRTQMQICTVLTLCQQIVPCTRHKWREDSAEAFRLLLPAPCVICDHASGNNFPGIASQFAMHFYMTAIQDIFCVAGFLHRSVQNLVWNICLLTESANQIRRGKLFPVHVYWTVGNAEEIYPRTRVRIRV